VTYSRRSSAGSSTSVGTSGTSSDSGGSTGSGIYSRSTRVRFPAAYRPTGSVRGSDSADSGGSSRAPSGIRSPRVTGRTTQSIGGAGGPSARVRRPGSSAGSSVGKSGSDGRGSVRSGDTLRGGLGVASGKSGTIQPRKGPKPKGKGGADGYVGGSRGYDGRVYHDWYSSWCYNNRNRWSFRVGFNWSWSWGYSPSCYWPLYTTWYYPWHYAYRYYYPAPAATVVYVEDSGPDVIYVDGGGRDEVIYVDDGPRAQVGEGRLVPAPDVLDPQPALTSASERYLTLGDRSFQEGRYQDAVQFYSRAIEFSPDVGVLYLILADALFATGDYHYAAYTIRRALELDPTLVDSVVDKHAFYGNPADFDEQLRILQNYLADHPVDDDARLVLATNLLFAGRPAQAASVLEGNPALARPAFRAGLIVLTRAQELAAEEAE